MILVDTALRARAASGNPVRFGIYGAGFMGRGSPTRSLNYVPGMALAAICNRTVEAAVAAYAEFGVPASARRGRPRGRARRRHGGRAARRHRRSRGLGGSDGIECLVEATGAVEYGARVTMLAIEHGKHMVLMNAELDGTVGPILKRAGRRGGCHPHRLRRRPARRAR